MNFKLLAVTTLLLTVGSTITNIANANTDVVTAQPAAATAKINYNNDIAYELHDCLRKRNTISCSLIVTSEVKDNTIFIDTRRTRFVDFNGNEYFSNFAKIGNFTTSGDSFSNRYGGVGNNFMKGIPLKASVKFDNIPENVNNFAVLNLNIQTNEYNPFHDLNRTTNIRFDKILVPEEPVSTTNVSSDSNNYNYQNVPVASEPVSVTDSLNSVKNTVSDVKQNVNTVRDILSIFR
ncbi:MAG: hypothetical protein ACRC1Z_16960 [Waterburya sp.]